jgi:ABC-type branched-subunit amino acid transport system ATPase component/predicted MFS family arabinose efflux permease
MERGTSPTDPPVGPSRRSAAALAAHVLDEEQARRSRERPSATVLPDDLLPGVGGDETSLRDAVREGGVPMISVLTLLLVFEEFDRVAIQVLGPDIQSTLGISDTLLAGLASLGGVMLVLCTLPFAYLADRLRRTRVLAGAVFLWSGFVALTAVVVNPFQMAIARGGAGVGASANIPISPALVTDTYPIGARTRMLAIEGIGRTIGQVAGPLAAGGVAAWIGGVEAWRTTLLLFAVPPLVLGAVLVVLPEPRRGRHDQLAVLGAELEVDDPPVRLSAAFQRLKKVRTFYFLVVGIGVLGFALVAVPTLMGLMLEDAPEYGYGALTRGWIISISWAGALVSIPLAGRYGERVFRRDPAGALRLAGIAVLLYGVLFTVGLRFREPALLVAFWTLANACQGAAFTTIRPAIAAVVPYRMRAQAFALVGVYIFLMGGFFGGLLGGAFSDAWGERTALTIIVPPAAVLGGLLIVYGSRFMKEDISLGVAELREEQEERVRIAADPANVPVLQVRGLDVSYGPLQVLFDVDIEVRRGETLALLGTNGAGKSTLLRSISGIVLPDRGVVRLNGRTVTFVAPELRARIGMVQVPGGEALFTSMTVRENLDIWSRLIADRSERAAAIERFHDVFPALRERLDQRAGSLSGGQQQMLALGKALVLEPEILLIDELSLGLAPIVVQELLAVVERLKQQGVTMVIVEQSVNVALAVADRAVFMERGQVRFQGPAQELLERDDLLRAVFLSGAGA